MIVQLPNPKRVTQRGRALVYGFFFDTTDLYNALSRARSFSYV